MTVLLNKMLLFLVLMALGYAGARRGLLKPDFTKGLSWLTMNVLLSATILNAAFSGGAELSLGEIGTVLLLFTLAFAFCYALSAGFTRLLRIKSEKAPIFELLISVVNSIYVGLPVLQALYPGVQRVVIYMAVSCLPFNFILFSYGVWRLRGGGKGSVRWKDMFSLPMLATLLSLPILLLRPAIPAVLREIVGTISGATVPMSMIVIGAALGRVRLVDAFTDGSLYLASLFRLLLVPVLTFLVLDRLPIDKILEHTVFVTMACPSGVLVSILSIQYGKDAEYASKGVLLSTALSMLTIPLLIALLL
ncbi:MAG: AEC family transporter [Oscillospiraceae bacterium]|nr:AEC family transporter [Oscillospiraceae bacterium]